MKQKKSIIPLTSLLFLLFYSPKPRSQVRILIYRKWSIESTYSDLPYNLKVNRGKLALINRPWKCKTGKDRRTPLVHSRKLGWT